MGSGEILLFEDRQSEKFADSVGAVFAAVYVNNLSVLLMPVHWLLMDGCSFLMSSASIIDSLLWFDWL